MEDVVKTFKVWVPESVQLKLKTIPWNSPQKYSMSTEKTTALKHFKTAILATPGVFQTKLNHWTLFRPVVCPHRPEVSSRVPQMRI